MNKQMGQTQRTSVCPSVPSRGPEEKPVGPDYAGGGSGEGSPTG